MSRTKLLEVQKKLENNYKRATKLRDERAALLKKLQATCQHEYCAERMLYSEDEWAKTSWHTYTRVCQECYLQEDGKFGTHNYYSSAEYNKFDKLAASKIVNKNNRLTNEEWDAYCLIKKPVW